MDPSSQQTLGREKPEVMPSGETFVLIGHIRRRHHTTAILPKHTTGLTDKDATGWGRVAWKSVLIPRKGEGRRVSEASITFPGRLCGHPSCAPQESVQQCPLFLLQPRSRHSQHGNMSQHIQMTKECSANTRPFNTTWVHVKITILGPMR